MLTSAGGILALLKDQNQVQYKFMLVILFQLIHVNYIVKTKFTLALTLEQYQEEQLKVQLTQFALKKLDLVVDEFWAEISDSIQTIEVIMLHQSS